MPNGSPGDDRIIDVIRHGLTVYGEPMVYGEPIR